MKRLLAILSLAAAGTAVITMLVITAASAHAPYDSSTPAARAVVTTLPTSVVINFKEEIQSTSGSYAVTVTKDGGGSVTSGAATVSGDTQLTVPLQPNLGAGRYVVNWNNTSADDGDPLSGAFAFYISTQPTSAQSASDQQLGAIEANQLATAEAEQAELPSSGSGPGADDGLQALPIVLAVIAALGIASVTLAAVQMRRT